VSECPAVFPGNPMSTTGHCALPEHPGEFHVAVGPKGAMMVWGPCEDGDPDCGGCPKDIYFLTGVE
jgi:hypothetical protein